MRKHALFVALGLALVAYWLWQKFQPARSLGDSADADFGKFLATGTVPGATSAADSADADFANFVATGIVPQQTNATANVGGDDGFTGGGGGESGGGGISRSD